MDTNNNKEKTNNSNNFKTVNDSKSFNNKKTGTKSNFGKNVVIPFFSGVLGCGILTLNIMDMYLK